MSFSHFNVFKLALMSSLEIIKIVQVKTFENRRPVNSITPIYFFIYFDILNKIHV